MTYTRENESVCSSHTTVRITPGHTIEEVSVAGGCDGNLKGVCSLLRGRSAEEAIALLCNIRCHNKATSCPAEIAKCLQEAILAQREAS